MSFQIFLLVGHLTNWTGHNLLTDNTLKKRTQDVLVSCSVIVSDHNVKLAGHFQNLVGQCPMTDCYFQHFIYRGYRIELYMGFHYLETDLGRACNPLKFKVHLTCSQTDAFLLLKNPRLFQALS